MSFVNGAMSAPKSIVCGVPQGSIMGLLLFILYINDLPDCLEKSTTCLYADDSQIFSSAKDCVEFNANLNNDLNNVSQWLVKNKLQHHSTKTKIMYVGSNNNFAKIDNEFPVIINDQLIPRVHSIPCLGVKLDETLNWNEHMEIVCKKVGAGIGILKRIKPYVPANTLISIYPRADGAKRRARVQISLSYLHPKALAESKVHQISRAWVINFGWSSSLISNIWRTVLNSGH